MVIRNATNYSIYKIKINRDVDFNEQNFTLKIYQETTQKFCNICIFLFDRPSDVPGNAQNDPNRSTHTTELSGRNTDNIDVDSSEYSREN